MLTKSAVRVAAIVMVLSLAPALALAAGIPGSIVPTECQGQGSAGSCGICSLAELAQNVINTGIFLAVILSAILFAWAGMKMVASQGGDTAGRKDAKKIFSNVTIGLVIILAAWLIVDTIFDALTGNHLWSQVC